MASPTSSSAGRWTVALKSSQELLINRAQKKIGHIEAPHGRSQPRRCGALPNLPVHRQVLLEGGEPHARCPFPRRVPRQLTLWAFRPLRRALLSARGSLFYLFLDPIPPNEGGRERTDDCASAHICAARTRNSRERKMLIAQRPRTYTHPTRLIKLLGPPHAYPQPAPTGQVPVADAARCLHVPPGSNS